MEVDWLGSTTTIPRMVICVPLASIRYVTSESASTCVIFWPARASAKKLINSYRQNRREEIEYHEVTQTPTIVLG